ncbi:MAG: hypothetical protein AAB229_09405 [Candidatus Hydrogenedentota bacterium]
MGPQRHGRGELNGERETMTDGADKTGAEEKFDAAFVPVIEEENGVEEMVSLDRSSLSVEDRLITAALETEEVEIAVRIDPRLKLGVALVASSFIISLLLGPIVAILYGTKWFAYAYGCSWLVFFIGIGIGGRPANEAVKNWRVRVHRTISERLRKRLEKRRSES